MLMEQLQYKGAGDRVDAWLSKELGYSRNLFQHIISRGGIKINNKPTKKSYKLKNNDNIIIEDFKRYFSSEILQETPDIDIPIVLEKDDYMIINKPKGTLSHPNSIRDVAKPSVVGFLYHKFKNLPSFTSFIRAGLIHRLDKDTDGLMIIVKTEKALAHFKSLFQSKSESATIQQKEDTKLKKFYRATCIVTPKGREYLESIKDNLPHYIEELVAPKTPNSIPKIGITKILGFNYIESSEDNNKNYNNIENNKIAIDLEILTGRTHQIRYHLSNHGLPIVGDYLYGAEDTLPLQLTSYKLFFTDCYGEDISIEI